MFIRVRKVSEWKPLCNHLLHDGGKNVNTANYFMAGGEGGRRRKGVSLERERMGERGGKGGMKYMEHRTKCGNEKCGRTVVAARDRKKDARISCAIRRERKLGDGTLLAVVHLSQPVSVRGRVLGGVREPNTAITSTTAAFTIATAAAAASLFPVTRFSFPLPFFFSFPKAPT